jgi:WD40 repeat protein
LSATLENSSLTIVRLAKEKGHAFIRLWNVSPEDQSVVNETTLTVDIGRVSTVHPTPTPTPPLDYEVAKEILAPGDETTTLDPVFGIRFADDSKFITAILSVQARLTEMPAGNESTARIRNLTTSRLHDDGVLELYFSPRSGGRFTTPLRASTTARISVTALVKDESAAINLLTTVEEVSFRTTSNDSPSGETVTRHVFALNGERAPTPTPSP